MGSFAILILSSPTILGRRIIASPRRKSRFNVKSRHFSKSRKRKVQLKSYSRSILEGVTRKH